MENSRVFHLGGRAAASDTSDNQNTQAPKGQSSRLSERIDALAEEHLAASGEEAVAAIGASGKESSLTLSLCDGNLQLIR